MKVGDTVRTSYFLYDTSGNPAGGEEAAILASSVLEKNGGATGESITVTASAGITGKYVISYVPLTTGHYELYISHATYNPSGQGQDWDITTRDIDDVYSGITAVDVDTELIIAEISKLPAKIWHYVDRGLNNIKSFTGVGWKNRE